MLYRGCVAIFLELKQRCLVWDLPQPLCLWISRNYLKLLANLGKLFAICFPFTHILYIWICWSFRGSLILPDAGLMQAVAYTCIYCIDTVLRLLHYTDFVYLPVRTLKDKISCSCHVSCDLSLYFLHFRSTCVYNAAVRKKKVYSSLRPSCFA